MTATAPRRRPVTADAAPNPSTSDPRRWHRRRALYAQRSARADSFYRTPQGALPGAEDAFGVLADQHHAALALLLATPAPTLTDAVMKLELYIDEHKGCHAEPDSLQAILADLYRFR